MQICTWQRIPPKPSVRNLGKCFTLPERARVILVHARRGSPCKEVPALLKVTGDAGDSCHKPHYPSQQCCHETAQWISSQGAKKPGCRPQNEPWWKHTLAPRLRQGNTRIFFWAELEIPCQQQHLTSFQLIVNDNGLNKNREQKCQDREC